MMKSLTERLDAARRQLPVQLGTELHQRVETDLAAQVEMRDGLLGLGQARGDGPAHPVKLDFLELAALVHRHDGIR